MRSENVASAVIPVSFASRSTVQEIPSVYCPSVDMNFTSNVSINGLTRTHHRPIDGINNRRVRFVRLHSSNFDTKREDT